MKETPILFSAPMVRAILEGRKTQTRRIVKGQALEFLESFVPEFVSLKENGFSKYGYAGDKLWVKETWQYVDFCGEDNGYVYRATDPDWETMEGWTWKPSIFMPKKACRTFLDITDIRIEKLQDITEEDAISEGIIEFTKDDKLAKYWYDHEGVWSDMPYTAKEAFEMLWVSINGEQSWNENPWVWVIDFKRENMSKNEI
jgi:hypothetical protein